MVIKSKDNQLYKFMRSLGTKKGRDRADAFIIEGARFVDEARKHCQILHIVMSETFAQKAGDVGDIVLTDFLFNALADTEHSQGILAVCRQLRPPDSMSAKGEKSRLFLLIEDINDPGNLGSIIRAADAAGADAVWLSRGCAELHNPKTLRGAAGSAFHIPIAENADLSEVLTALKNDGVTIYAAHLAGAAYPYGLDLRSCCAFIIGNEARGLSRQIAAAADVYVKLPIIGQAESLNAATATGILLYEAVRQRL